MFSRWIVTNITSASVTTFLAFLVGDHLLVCVLYKPLQNLGTLVHVLYATYVCTLQLQLLPETRAQVLVHDRHRMTVTGSWG
jgi:hypothetical protein